MCLYVKAAHRALTPVRLALKVERLIRERVGSAPKQGDALPVKRGVRAEHGNEVEEVKLNRCPAPRVELGIKTHPGYRGEGPAEPYSFNAVERYAVD